MEAAKCDIKQFQDQGQGEVSSPSKSISRVVLTHKWSHVYNVVELTTCLVSATLRMLFAEDIKRKSIMERFVNLPDLVTPKHPVPSEHRLMKLFQITTLVKNHCLSHPQILTILFIKSMQRGYIPLQCKCVLTVDHWKWRLTRGQQFLPSQVL